MLLTPLLLPFFSSNDTAVLKKSSDFPKAGLQHAALLLRPLVKSIRREQGEFGVPACPRGGVRGDGDGNWVPVPVPMLLPRVPCRFGYLQVWLSLLLGQDFSSFGAGFCVRRRVRMNSWCLLARSGSRTRALRREPAVPEVQAGDFSFRAVLWELGAA